MHITLIGGAVVAVTSVTAVSESNSSNITVTKRFLGNEFMLHGPEHFFRSWQLVTSTDILLLLWKSKVRLFSLQIAKRS